MQLTAASLVIGVLIITSVMEEKNESGNRDGMKNDKVVLDVLKRAAAKKTQKVLAKELKVTPQYLNDVLHGRREVMEKIAAKFGFEAVWRKGQK